MLVTVAGRIGETETSFERLELELCAAHAVPTFRRISAIGIFAPQRVVICRVCFSEARMQDKL